MTSSFLFSAAIAVAAAAAATAGGMVQQLNLFSESFWKAVCGGDYLNSSRQ
jgi:opacity protein-like surface antigen